MKVKGIIIKSFFSIIKLPNYQIIKSFFSIIKLSNYQIIKSVILIFLPSLVFSQGAPEFLFLKTMDAMTMVQTARYRLEITERINGEVKWNEYFVKLQVKPLKIYEFSLTTNIGTEALYIEGTNKNQALVNPNRFPWFNLNLSPYSMIIRKGHQYTLDQAGFTYIHNMLEYYMNQDRANFLSHITLIKDTVFDAKLCSRILIDCTGFNWCPYIVGKGETITSIAKKFFLNDYMIMERNRRSNYNDVREGDKIMIPTIFARKIILAIDKNTRLPIQQIIYDDKGLFSAIEFRSISVNIPIKDEEFSKSYKEYGF